MMTSVGFAALRSCALHAERLAAELVGHQAPSCHSSGRKPYLSPWRLLSLPALAVEQGCFIGDWVGGTCACFT